MSESDSRINNRGIILAGVFVAAAGGAIYIIRQALNFDLTIEDPTKGEYYKGDPVVDEPKAEEYEGQHEDMGVLHVMAPN